VPALLVDDVPVVLATVEASLDALLVLASDGGANGAPPCWPTAWNRSPRNCWSAALSEVLEVLDVAEVSELDELDVLLPLDDVVLALDWLMPNCESAASIAAASGLMFASEVAVVSDEDDDDEVLPLLYWEPRLCR
jgi:hypothetical protein